MASGDKHAGLAGDGAEERLAVAGGRPEAGEGPDDVDVFQGREKAGGLLQDQMEGGTVYGFVKAGVFPGAAQEIVAALGCLLYTSRCV